MFKCKVFSSFSSTGDLESSINSFLTQTQPSEIVSMVQSQCVDDDDYDVYRTVTIIYKEKQTQQG